MISLCVMQYDDYHYEITTTDVRDKRPIRIIMPENKDDYRIYSADPDSVSITNYANGPGFLPVTENL